MAASVAVVADDLTGAADAAAAFLRASLRVSLTWPARPIDLSFIHESDVVAIDARTRRMDRAGATAATTTAVSTMFDNGVLTVYKKIDSTLRGHVGSEVLASLDAWHPGTLAIVAPAFPAMRRTTLDGHQHVNGLPLERPGIATMLEEAGIRSRVARLADVRADGLRSVFEECRADGVRAIVCDAEIDADLVAIAQAGIELAPRLMWVGSAGLAHAIAGRIGPRTGRVPRVVAQRTDSGGVLTVVGSGSHVSREQVQHLIGSGITTIEVPRSILEGEDGRARATFSERIIAALRAGDLLVSLPQPSDDHENPTLARRLAEILQPCGVLATALVITGGETATHVLDHWGVWGLTLVDEVEPGVPLGITIGAGAMPIVTKAGAFGDARTLERAMRRLRNMMLDMPKGLKPGDPL
jgi:D-threonate/D-erythronate kinase